MSLEPQLIKNALEDREQHDVKPVFNMSIRVPSAQLRLFTGSLRRIMNHLKLHRYKIQLTQELHIVDHQKGLDLARDFLQLASDDFISRLIMSDEAHFNLPEHVNKQNCRYWSADNPIIIHEHPLHHLEHNSRNPDPNS